ncbi:ArsR family transcriptional regulator [Jiangella aurantiaca]|uniref:ArsR family transcriptional regulator n=1 Tax=Jiangella aurantiaca TaxID=2530373 RepID=A0A4R5ADA6_9ACTN|nr:metalloregulator ArsR/SmtB family transcription factor [Jiangella aurantiaca]TDD70448.1 ArsR family transcriptional regulator [Jiangella aurantiaca]
METYGCFGVLGDATRRSIVERLRHAPASVGELAAGLPVSRPAVSQHLKVLAEAGLVVSSAAGTRRIYRLAPEGFAALRSELDQLWGDAMAAFAAAEAEGEADGNDERHDRPA